MPVPNIEIISATRLNEHDFWESSPLGISIRRLSKDARFRSHIAFSNKRGLPGIFNERIATARHDDILVFVHDDVWIDDYFLGDRLNEGLAQYDVLGVVGNRRRLPSQVAWPFVDKKFTWDEPENLSGVVAHGQYPFGELSIFGASPAACELLDGVFLAANAGRLKQHKITFDIRFDFHFYDMDFCRSARKNGMKLGTWPICLTHQSEGNFNTEAWQKKCNLYLKKWGD